MYDINKFSDSINTKMGWVGLTADSLYSALGGVKIIPEYEVPPSAKSTYNFITLNMTAEIPDDYVSFIRSHPEISTDLVAGLFNGKELIKEFDLKISAQQIAGWKKPFLVMLPINDVSRKKIKELRFGLRSKNYLPTHNSEKIELLGF